MLQRALVSALPPDGAAVSEWRDQMTPADWSAMAAWSDTIARRATQRATETSRTTLDLPAAPASKVASRNPASSRRPRGSRNRGRR